MESALDPAKLSLSARLFKILSKSIAKGDKEDNADYADTESDEEFPLECCFCSELFFETPKFDQHSCGREPQVENIVRKQHSCTFKTCNKSFKKSSDLRKHQVSN